MERCGALILLGLLSGAASQTTLTGVTMFNCQRTGVTCNGGGSCVDPAGTSCRCPTGTTLVRDIHCVKDAEIALPCKDNSKCGPSGTCFVSSATDTCYCDQLHYGDSCQNSRVEVTCGTNDMTVSVTPHGTFAGLIYTKDQRAVSACALTNTAGTLAGTFNFDTADSTNCGVATSFLLNATDARIGYQFSVKLLVQYNAGYLLDTDQELTVTCNFPNEATVTSVVFEMDTISSSVNSLLNDRLCYVVSLLMLTLKSMI